MEHSFTPHATGPWRTGLLRCLLAMGLTACGGGGSSDSAVQAPQATVNAASQVQVNGRVRSAPSAGATFDVVILEADPAIAAFEHINATGQVAFTRLGPDGPHALLYNGQTLQDLGPGYTAAINDAAQVAGYTAASPAHALRWTTAGRSPAAVIDLGAPADASSMAQAINAAGQVAGSTSQNSPVGSGQSPFHPFLWTEGSGRFDLGTLLLPGFIPVSANQVNALGQVAGAAVSTSLDPSQGAHAYLWTPTSGMRELGTLGGRATSATALNDAGQVAGSSNTEIGPLRGPPLQHHAFVWSAAAGMRDLGTLGGRSSDTRGLNALGQVAGNSDTANGTDLAANPLAHAFFWSPSGPNAGRMRDLGTLGEGLTSSAAGLNDSGQVAGTSGTSPTSIQPHAFIWTAAEGLVDLNHRIPTAPAGLTVTLATAISQDGAILGYAGRSLVLLTPSGDRLASARLSIASPPGAWRPYPGLAGSARFNAVIRSGGSGQKPTGQTRFRLASAGLNFESSGYDWLNVQPSRAQYQGSGSLNGTGGYQFRVTLMGGTRDNPDDQDSGDDVDGENDSGNAHHANHGSRADGPARLRIRIWHLDAAQGALVVDYDNQLDAGTEGTADEGTASGSGRLAVRIRQPGKAQERHAGR